MDEFNINPFDPSEIDKIQADIEKDLLRPNTEANEIEGQISLDSFSKGDAYGVTGVRETVDSSVIMPDYGNNECLNNNTFESADFYRETVKNEGERQRKSRFKRIVAVICVVAVLGGLSIGVAIPVASRYLIPKLNGSSNTATVPNAPESSFAFVRDSVDGMDKSMNESLIGVPSFADLIEKVEPSVACITSVMTSATAGSIFSPSTEYSEPHGGSGIIFDKDDEKLYIVTNNHVVSGATSVSVSVNGSDDVPANLVGRDVNSDLAVISVKIKDLQAKGINDYVIAAFGSSETMRVGDFVIAIGNALGKGNTATFGFVSAVDKEINIDGRNLTVIQTDAAINPGNSGGPLINLNGEVIGINMVKYVEARVEGTGYALTSDVAMPIIEQIRNQTSRPMLGIGGKDMTETVSNAFNLPMMGVIVDSVIEGSGAEKAGIKQSDIITSFDGQTVLSMEQLSAEVKKKNVGDSVEVKLIRNGTDNVTVTVTLTENNTDSF